MSELASTKRERKPKRKTFDALLQIRISKAHLRRLNTVAAMREISLSEYVRARLEV